MHDLRIIREAPDRFDQALKRRGLVPQSTHILDLDRRRRAAQTALQDMLTRRNFVSKQVGDAKRKGENTTALIEEVQSLKVGITKMLEVIRNKRSKTSQRIVKNEIRIFMKYY